jgi:hypothetical protein
MSAMDEGSHIMIRHKGKLAVGFACAATGVLLAMGAGQSQPHESELGEMRIHRPTEIEWKKGPPSLPPGAEFAVLEGDPSKPAPFVFRVKVPDGYTVPAHTHPKAERISVITGTFNIAMGDHLDKESGKVMPAGSFGYWPAGMKHMVWVTGDSIIQFHGVGPWEINYLDPADDPRNARD